jgi:hypothetical protein
VPSISIGFWVASTTNGSGSSWRTPATVTARSCIASSSADCVLGVARLISSASSTWWNTGPGLELEAPLARLLDEDGAAGHVGGHQVGRELHAAEGELGGVGERAHQARLAQARGALDQHVPAGERRHEQVLDQHALTEHHPRDGVAQARERFGEAADGVVGHRGSWGPREHLGDASPRPRITDSQRTLGSMNAASAARPCCSPCWRTVG